jgi:hypothetical protein
MMLSCSKTVAAMCLGILCLSVPPAMAHDNADTSPTAVTSVTDRFAPWGPYDDAYNGYKVYLSSPRHTDSGQRGECRNPGFEENVNGRRWNWYAANGNYIGETLASTNPSRNLHGRGYGVIVSPNTRDGGYLRNRDASRNWGSDLHIVTHTNALSGCAQYSSYLLTMWDSATDEALATELGRVLHGGVPGGLQGWAANLAELSTDASRGDAYVELQFHDNPYAQKWIYSETANNAWRYGYAVDLYLNYP